MRILIGRIQLEAILREKRRGRCSECRWWWYHAEVTSGDRGFCRRKAPNADTLGRAAWPSTLGHHGCGDFIRNTPVPPKKSAGEVVTVRNPNGGAL